MRKVKVLGFVSLDGVIQAPGGPEEETSGGFAYGGCVNHDLPRSSSGGSREKRLSKLEREFCKEGKKDVEMAGA